MQTLYNIATGPLAWAAFVVFLLGSGWRIADMISRTRKKDMSAYAYLSLKYSLRSIVHWLIPYGTQGWRSDPLLTAAAFLFHICLLLLLLFAPGHAVMWDYCFGLSLWSLPESLADILALLAISCCACFAWRRLAIPAVHHVSGRHDWIALALVALPLITGILAKHMTGGGQAMSLIHVLSGEAMLAALPFTRLSHALFAPFTRAYMGSEFGGVRHVPDW
jgi:nitrate reductase gamma subunit